MILKDLVYGDTPTTLKECVGEELSKWMAGIFGKISMENIFGKMFQILSIIFGKLYDNQMDVWLPPITAIVKLKYR